MEFPSVGLHNLKLVERWKYFFLIDSTPFTAPWPASRDLWTVHVTVTQMYLFRPWHDNVYRPVFLQSQENWKYDDYMSVI
jgi:hypothetical protein